MRALLAELGRAGYDFTTITPASHKRVARRWTGLGAGVRDLFGWSRIVDPGTIDAPILVAARAASALTERDGGVASTVRVSRVAGRLFAHSAWPTRAADSVFLGPDSYRFARFITANLGGVRAGARVVDIGTGAGVGGIVAADALGYADLTLTDLNPRALAFARANAAHAGHAARFVHTTGLDGIDGPFDLALANPPFMIDPARRSYRDGGGDLGTALALELARQAISHLAPGGWLLLYTGSPIVDGRDPFRTALASAVGEAGATIEYAEIDPDIFGEELGREAYARVDRIALVGAVIVRPLR